MRFLRFAASSAPLAQLSTAEITLGSVLQRVGHSFWAGLGSSALCSSFLVFRCKGKKMGAAGWGAGLLDRGF